MSKKLAYTDEHKELVSYLKEQLRSRGVEKLPRDWHLKQLATARIMLAGDKAPTMDNWKACIDWAFQNPFWKDKVDHLAAIERLWPKYMLQTGGTHGTDQRKNTRRGQYSQGRYIDSAIKNDKLPF